MRAISRAHERAPGDAAADRLWKGPDVGGQTQLRADGFCQVLGYGRGVWRDRGRCRRLRYRRRDRCRNRLSCPCRHLRTQGGVRREHAVIAMQMPARRWNEPRQPVEQFQRRQRDLPATVRARLVEGIDQALAVIRLRQPFGGPAWPRAIAQQALQRRAIIGSDTDRRVDRESAAVVPCGHVLGGLRVQHAMPAVGRQHPPSHPRLHPGHHVGVDGRGHKGEGLAVCRREHAVADAAVVVPVLIERRTEALQKAHRADARTRRRRSAAAQFALDAADEDTQHPRRQRRVVAQCRAQSLRQGQHPLPHRHPRDHRVDQMRRRRCHALGGARRAHAAAFAREGNEELRRAVRTARPREAVRENPALQIGAQLALDMGRHRLGIRLVVMRNPGRQPSLHGLPGQRALWPAAAVDAGRTD